MHACTRSVTDTGAAPPLNQRRKRSLTAACPREVHTSERTLRPLIRHAPLPPPAWRAPTPSPPALAPAEPFEAPALGYRPTPVPAPRGWGQWRWGRIREEQLPEQRVVQAAQAGGGVPTSQRGKPLFAADERSLSACVVPLCDIMEHSSASCGIERWVQPSDATPASCR